MQICNLQRVQVHHLWWEWTLQGLSDALLKEIIYQASTITDLSNLLTLGVCSVEQAQANMKIVHIYPFAVLMLVYCF